LTFIKTSLIILTESILKYKSFIREAQQMSVYFSEKFKKLRKDKDLTQEEIADIFHVSPQAVSRWETGATYPDIELLPHIAIFFKITLDELLGTEEILGEAKAKEYIRDIRNLLNSGKLYDAIDLARKAVKEYPLNNGLKGHLMQALCKVCSEETPGYEENIKKYKDEIIKLGENGINKIDLVRLYAKWGMKEEARKILETMPGEIWDSKEVWYGCIYEGEEWRKHQQVTMIRIMVMLQHFIGEYKNKAGLEPLQKIECIKIQKQLGEIMAPITSDVASSFHDDVEAADHVGDAFGNISLAGLYCEAGDIENALDHVEKGTQYSMYHIDVMDKTNSDGSNYMAWSTPRNLPWILWEDELSKPQFDIIRNHERFIKCFELLKANSRELK